MNKKILALSLLLLLTTVCISSMSILTAKAQSSSWITSYEIYNSNSNQLLVQYNANTGLNQTLAAVEDGYNVKVTFTVNVLPGSGSLYLSTDLNPPATGNIWSLATTGYNLGSSFNPAASSTQIAWTQGTFTMNCYGVVPTPTSTQGPATVDMVQLYGSTGTVLASISVTTVSANLAEFTTLYNKYEADLKSLTSAGVVQGYTELYTNVLAQALAEANQGEVTSAINLLGALNVPNQPPSATVQAIYIPLIVVVAVIAAIFAFLFMRIRGRISYFQLVVEDQIKDLEGLTLRISKIDRQSSSSLESVEDRLKRLVGT